MLLLIILTVKIISTLIIINDGYYAYYNNSIWTNSINEYEGKQAHIGILLKFL